MFGKNKNKKYIKFRYDLIGLKIGIEIFEKLRLMKINYKIANKIFI